MKKAQGLSMQMIVIAALSLIVIIVLIFILTGKFNFFNQNTATCESKGGICAGTNGKCDNEHPLRIKTADCKIGSEEMGICCVKVG